MSDQPTIRVFDNPEALNEYTAALRAHGAENQEQAHEIGGVAMVRRFEALPTTQKLALAERWRDRLPPSLVVRFVRPRQPRASRRITRVAALATPARPSADDDPPLAPSRLARLLAFLRRLA